MTIYGHLFLFAQGIHAGSIVSQGETIGYVDMSGMTTGPHVHYELKINGLSLDPLRIVFPVGLIHPSYLPQFYVESNLLEQQLVQLRNTNLSLL